MKIASTFSTALLVASTYAVSAKETAIGVEETTLDGISLWNCTTCTLTFSEIDKIL
jgi:hypothetical protein